MSCRPWLVLLLLASALALASSKDDKPRCGNTEGGICCQAWGNTCIDNNLSCCNGTCIKAAYNASDPLKACGGTSPRGICSVNDLLVKTPKFSSANAWVMTVLATAVYPSAWALPDDDKLVGTAFATWIRPFAITNATFLEAHSTLHAIDTEGVCMRDDSGNVFVVFRGTSSATDAATDADVIGSLVPSHNKMFGGKGVQLHDGFADAYKFVRQKTRDCVTNYMQHFNTTAAANSSTAVQPTLWVGGHSLGAALASLAAADFARMGYSPIVYTLGSPRVGDKDWQELYDVELKLKNQTYRMVNKNDPVARVPITTLGYRHVGTRVDVNATRGTCIVPSEETECNPSCVVAEHYTDQYLNATLACVEDDGSIDLEACPQTHLTSPINYDLLAAEPGQATFPNGSKAAATSHSSTVAVVLRPLLWLTTVAVLLVSGLLGC